MPWLWAAYRMGAYADVLPEGLDDDMFTDTALDIIESADHGFIIEAPGDKGLQPVGIVLGTEFGKSRCLEPHVDWFPWATPRNKMEGAAAFLRQVKHRFKIFLFIDDDGLEFYDRISKFRLVTRGCKVIDHYGPGKHAMMYYTTGF